jgi:hypothetical protein
MVDGTQTKLKQREIPYMTPRGNLQMRKLCVDLSVIDVSFTKNSLHFVLADGREISAPLEWFPKLRDASEIERNNWRFIANCIGVHWPNIDEDIAVRTLMRGNEG